MLSLVRYDNPRPGCATRFRVLVLAICTAALTLAGPGGGAFARAEAPCEAESKAPASQGEYVENLPLLRITERGHVHCMRRAFRSPIGSCAGDRTFRFSHHTSSRPLDAEHCDRNGFGGPLLR